MKRCLYCGHEIPDAASFCPHCGKNLETLEQGGNASAASAEVWLMIQQTCEAVLLRTAISKAFTDILNKTFDPITKMLYRILDDGAYEGSAEQRNDLCNILNSFNSAIADVNQKLKNLITMLEDCGFVAYCRRNHEQLPDLESYKKGFAEVQLSDFDDWNDAVVAICDLSQQYQDAYEKLDDKVSELMGNLLNKQEQAEQ